jgi:hypothetical protein
MFDIIGELAKLVPPEVKIPPEYQSGDGCPIPDASPLSLAQLSAIYQKSNPHRFGLEEIQALLNTDVMDQTMMANKLEEWNSFGLDLANN